MHTIYAVGKKKRTHKRRTLQPHPPPPAEHPAEPPHPFVIPFSFFLAATKTEPTPQPGQIRARRDDQTSTPSRPISSTPSQHNQTAYAEHRPIEASLLTEQQDSDQHRGTISRKGARAARLTPNQTESEKTRGPAKSVEADDNEQSGATPPHPGVATPCRCRSGGTKLSPAFVEAAAGDVRGPAHLGCAQLRSLALGLERRAPRQSRDRTLCPLSVRLLRRREGLASGRSNRSLVVGE